jgi:hypothetical protein
MPVSRGLLVILLGSVALLGVLMPAPPTTIVAAGEVDANCVLL